MRYAQPVAMVLGAVTYVVVIVMMGTSTPEMLPWYLVIVGVWHLLLVAATVVAIVDSIRKIRANRTRDLATDAMRVKLVAIPFFLLNFVLLNYLVYAGGALILFGGLLLWVAVVIGVGLSYLAMVSTSVYVWAAIAQLRRERILALGLTVVYVILSLVFVTDTVTGVLQFAHTRRRPLLALVIVLLSFGLGAVCVGFSPVLIFGWEVALNVFDFAMVGGVVALVVAVIASAALLPVVRREGRRIALGMSPEIVTTVWASNR